MTSQELEQLRQRPKGYHRTKREREIEAHECVRLKVLGWTDVAVAARMNLTRQTVAKRVEWFAGTQHPKTASAYREIIAQRYEVGMERLAPRVDEGDLDALRLWFDANAKFSRLVGADAPAQMAVEVTQVTEQEKQLRDMLAQAERDEKARETVLIEGEVVEDVL